MPSLGDLVWSEYVVHRLTRWSRVSMQSVATAAAAASVPCYYYVRRMCPYGSANLWSVLGVM